MIILIASAVFVAACFFISFLPRKTKEIYGMDHALLNDVSGSSDRPSSSTMWLNMGLWKDEDSYVDACAALASLLMDTALKGKQEGTKWKIFDYGYGCGDQILHWLDKYSNHIELLSGVTSEGIQAKWASKKISEYLESAAFLSKTHRPRGILLYRGDAMGPRSSWEQLALPSAAAIDHDYDLVISLDSCYHYNTRRHFFRQVYQQLRPGGILSMTDLILAEGLTRDQELKMGITAGFGVPSSSLKSHVNLLIQNIILYLIAMATSIPFLNLQTLENYVVDLGKSGFSNIEVFDISPHVFIGLSNSIDRQTRKYQQAKSPSPSGWGKYRFVVGPFMRWLDSTRLLRFVVVRAEKRIVK